MYDKAIGYTLLGLGIIIIFLAFFSAFQVATGENQPYRIFNSEGISIDLSKLLENPTPPATTTASPAAYQTELISADVLNKPMNFVAYFIFMGFIASIGHKISLIGVYLIRPINVQVKGEVQNKL